MHSLFEIAVVLLLSAISGALVVIAMVLKRALEPTIDQRLRVLEDRTAFNLRLIDEVHQKKLVRFALSEASLVTELDDLSKKSKVDELDEGDQKIVKTQSRWDRFKTWIGANAGTLLGKVNDIAKSALGLGGKT